jgi:hypothetical protein
MKSLYDTVIRVFRQRHVCSHGAQRLDSHDLAAPMADELNIQTVSWFEAECDQTVSAAAFCKSLIGRPSYIFSIIP